MVKFAEAAWNVLWAIVVPLPRTRLVPLNVLSTPEVAITVPVVKPDSVKPVSVGEPDHAGVVPPTRTCEDVPTAKRAGVDPDDE